MTRFEDYRDAYRHVRMKREGGILELCFHTDGDSLKWAGPPHEEFGRCFHDVANDPDNRVVIITGAGDAFCNEVDASSFGELSPRIYLDLYQEARRLIGNLLDIDVPVIGAVNGPAHIHAELVLLSNIVVASDRATFQDGAHFPLGVVPGDGVHVFWPKLLGPTRASYFLLTGEILDAEQAKALGVVNEVVPAAEVLPRAWALAELIAQRPVAAARYSRVLLTHEMKKAMHEQLGHGLAVEGLAMLGGFID
jgi:enoyl-CoA hydratase/carnithine racemase